MWGSIYICSTVAETRSISGAVKCNIGYHLLFRYTSLFILGFLLYSFWVFFFIHFRMLENGTVTFNPNPLALENTAPTTQTR